MQRLRFLIGMDHLTGYQQSILYLLGSRNGERFAVRSTDKWYIDNVSDIFQTRPYFQIRRANGKRDYWCIKDRFVTKPSLAAVTDWTGFCRGFIELQGSLALWSAKTRNGGRSTRLRLRIWGAESDLQVLSSVLPTSPKKIQHISTATGKTCALYFQNRLEIYDIMDYIDGAPRNERLWSDWQSVIASFHKEG